MNKLILTTILGLIARIDFDALSAVIRAAVVRRIGPALQEQIERLVAYMDRLDIPGGGKFAAVVEQLSAPDSPVRQLVEATPGYVLRWAIESAVLRLRTNA